MKSNSLAEDFTSESILSFAKRNYKTYVQHYKDRNLIQPMSENEFLQNYCS